MKKIRIVAVSAAVVLALGITTAFAAGGRYHAANYSRYVDADGDGICDYYGAGLGRGCVDADGDGICDYYGAGLGRGCVDADGDGICDYHGTACRYTDVDGDGVCDYRGTGLGGGHCGGRRGCGSW